MDWKPKRTLKECDRILTAPGSTYELEIRVIDGRVQRVYKNLWPSLRAFWVWVCHEHASKICVVFGPQRYTFLQVMERAEKAAHIFRTVYRVKKGDRIAICSRNYPDYLVAFWACHLIGAVPVLVNAWLPQDGLLFCITHTQSKVLILDPERADVLEPVVKELSKSGVNAILVLESKTKTWVGMSNWITVLDGHRGDTDSILKDPIDILPEDNATIYFTSGTTGRPKGVLSTQRQYLTNVLNAVGAGLRATLRRGEDLVPPQPGPQKGILIAVPFFHVTGTTSHTMLAALLGFKIVLMWSWNPQEAVKLIKAENIVMAGGVPSMVADLIEIGGFSLETATFGGAPASKMLPAKVKSVIAEANVSQGYGATETNSVAVSLSGEDQLLRPTSCGLPTLVNDLIVVDPNSLVVLPLGQVGEVWIRGPNIMQEYWRDPEATRKAITQDGWFRTGDLGYLDEEGFLYIKDRLKDIIIRGGENIVGQSLTLPKSSHLICLQDSVSVENALYEEPGVQEAAAVGVPHEKLGEVVAAVVSVRPNAASRITEESLINLARKRLPRFAVPVIVIVLQQELEHTPSGKVKKGPLRKLARTEWEKKQKANATSKL